MLKIMLIFCLHGAGIGLTIQLVAMKVLPSKSGTEGRGFDSRLSPRRV